MSAASTHEVWFLTGNQALHGQETLAQLAADSREIAAHFDLAGIQHVRIGHGTDLAELKNELRWSDRTAK